MNASATGGLAIMCAVIGVWIYLAVKSDDDPAALKTIVGCFASSETIPADLEVRREGTLTFGTQDTRVSGYRDKGGIAINPQRAVMIDSQDHNRLELDTTYALLLRFDESAQTLDIPDYRGGPSALFHRVRCS